MSEIISALAIMGAFAIGFIIGIIVGTITLSITIQIWRYCRGLD